MENEVRFIPILVLSSIIAFPGWSQERDLKSIGETTDAMSDPKLVGPYIFARCAGFYDGLMGYGGANFPPDMQQTLKDAGLIFTFASAVVKQKNAVETGRGPSDLDPYVEQAAQEVSQFADIYIDRFRENYALSGSMMESDKLAADDLAMCQEVFPVADQIVSRARGK